MAQTIDTRLRHLTNTTISQVMDWFVYIVRCADNSLYTGVAMDVERRVMEHNESPKGARYTSSRRPVHVVYTAACATRSDAMKEEWRIKKLARAEKLVLIQTYEPSTASA